MSRQRWQQEGRVMAHLRFGLGRRYQNDNMTSIDLSFLFIYMYMYIWTFRYQDQFSIYSTNMEQSNSYYANPILHSTRPQFQGHKKLFIYNWQIMTKKYHKIQLLSLNFPQQKTSFSRFFIFDGPGIKSRCFTEEIYDMFLTKQNFNSFIISLYLFVMTPESLSSVIVFMKLTLFQNFWTNMTMIRSTFRFQLVYITEQYIAWWTLHHLLGCSQT